MPLDDLALNELFQKLATPVRARDMVRERRQSGPVRRVQGGRSVQSRFPSLKNGVTVQCESRTLEAAACWARYEHNPRVLAYYDQPFTMTIAYVPPGAPRKGTKYTPDFLVIYEDRIVVEEWKHHDELRLKGLSEPGRYLEDPNGVWRHPAAEARCREFGFDYELHTDRDLPDLLVRNERLSDPFLGVDAVDTDELMRYVHDVPGVSFATLLTSVPGATIEKLMALVANRHLWVNRERVLLTAHDVVQVFETEEQGQFLQTAVPIIPTGEVPLTPDSRVLWNSVCWTVQNAGPEKITLTDEGGRPQVLTRQAALDLVRIGELRAHGTRVIERAELFKNMSATDQALATQKLEAIRPYLEASIAPKSRTHQRWVREYEMAKATFGEGLLGLARNRPTGPAARRVSARALELAHIVIKEVLLTPDRRPRRSGYVIYEERCLTEGVNPVSQPTFRGEYDRLLHGKGVQQRFGSKIAKTLAPPRPIAGPSVHGDRFFDKVHIDHTELEIEIIDSATNVNLGRAWLTLAIDAYTRRILGHVLSLDPPSAGKVMLVIRDIVARWGRLPTEFMLDNGSDFKSEYLQQTAAAFIVSLAYRPPHTPRFGAIIESAFGRLNERLINFLRGNTAGRKDIRSQDPEHDASARAVWTLDELEQNLSTYFYEVYDQMDSNTDGLSPQQRANASMKAVGISPREPISDDFHFRVMTALRTKTEKVKVSRQGIKVQNVRYWCDALADWNVQGTKVAVRWEPFDRSVAYAFVSGEWRLCHSAHREILEGRTERELRIASIELTKRLKRTPSARQLAAHLEKTLQTEEALLERKRAVAAQQADGAQSRSSRPNVRPAPAAAPAGAPDPLADVPIEDRKEWTKERVA